MSNHRAAITLVGAVISLASCTYYNSVFNAERLYEQAERSRRAGQDSLSRVRYLDVISRTAEAYRARPESDWAGDALFLLGRSRLRLGELRAARAALIEAAALSADASTRSSVTVYLAAVLAEGGNEAEALARVNEALSVPLEEAPLAEAHLLRGRLLLAHGYPDQGWWDLDRAVEVLRDVRVEAGLERFRWALHHGDTVRTRQAATGLLSYSEAGERIDSIMGLVAASSERWGPATAASFLSGADSSTWNHEAKGHMRLERARLLQQAGDTAAATEQAWNVATTLGDAAAEARLQLAEWRLAAMTSLADASSVRRILLPAGGHAEVAALVEAIEVLEVYTGIGLEEPLGLFVAAEVARDELGADYLARGFFLAYAATAPQDPWAPKALLAALEISRSEGDRAWLRGRLEADAESPYVLAANGQPAAGFEALEEELRVRLRAIRVR